MSAPAAGKFQDHYEVLGVDIKSDSETIQKAYAKLAEKYNPRTSPEGNQEKFDAVNLAYEILSDPQNRQEFDRLKGIGEAAGPPRFSGEAFFVALNRQNELRTALLCLLYDRRRVRPFTPSLSMRHLETMLDVASEELNFVLWYLKQRGFAAADDKSSLLITVEGMDYLEQLRPDPQVAMRFIKKEALAEEAPAPAPSAEAHAAANSGAIQSLRRSLGASIRQRP